MAPAHSPPRPSVFGVLYAEDFDDDGELVAPDSPEPAPEPEIIDPVFTLAELEAARDEGRRAGLLEAEAGLAASRTRLVAQLAEGVAEAKESAREVAEAAAEAVARIVLTALATQLPALCERHGAEELRAMMRSLIPALTDEARVVVRVNPHMVAAMEAEFACFDPEVTERLHLVPTDAIAPGDVRVSWAGGSAVRDTGRARAAFEDGLSALGLLQRELADA